MAQILRPQGQTNNAVAHYVETAAGDVALCHSQRKGVIVDQVWRLECLQARYPGEIPRSGAHDRQIRFTALDEIRHAKLEILGRARAGAEGGNDGDIAARGGRDITHELGHAGSLGTSWPSETAELERYRWVCEHDRPR